MNDYLDRLIERVLSGDTPESEILGLGMYDLEYLASGMEQHGADIHDLLRVYEVLESVNGECNAFARGLSFGAALELGELPGAAAIVTRLRADQPGTPPLTIFGARGQAKLDTFLFLNANQLVELKSAVSELNGLYIHLPAQATIDVQRGRITGFHLDPLDAETLDESRSFVESLYARGEIGFSDPLPPQVSHHVMVDGRGRRVLERFRFVD